MKKYFIFSISVSLSLFIFQSCGSKETQPADNLAKKDSVTAPAKEVTVDNTEPNYMDTLVGKWLLVGKGDKGVYIHSINMDQEETFIVIEKKGTDYLLTATYLDIDMPGPDTYKMDSIQRVFAGTIANCYEYVVQVTNIKTNEKRELYFSPLHQSMQNAIRISGFGPDEVHQYFMNENQKDKYIVSKEE